VAALGLEREDRWLKKALTWCLISPHSLRNASSPLSFSLFAWLYSYNLFFPSILCLVSQILLFCCF